MKHVEGIFIGFYNICIFVGYVYAIFRSIESGHKLLALAFLILLGCCAGMMKTEKLDGGKK